ncbi:uncharacterized protein N7484_010285 [Penicillium longicatenatum]|uniref:uncharacterized protein n=1 Tax=Penicillium longicatenatum TaxID=1561947 RepID=UPI0025467741|nr:uncharacterized protein N7484_010285 [Penicillium longicatenatum]KAJ5630185.1 hypothetical protein N7484_010285 [Penicillium longicatenatum]
MKLSKNAVLSILLLLTANVAATFQIVCATDSNGDYYVTPNGNCGLRDEDDHTPPAQSFNIDSTGNVVRA